MHAPFYFRTADSIPTPTEQETEQPSCRSRVDPTCQSQCEAVHSTAVDVMSSGAHEQRIIPVKWTGSDDYNMQGLRSSLLMTLTMGTYYLSYE